MSGLVGLSRLEWIPVAYKYHVEIESYQADAARLREAQQMGQQEVPVVDDERGNVPIEEAIEAQDNTITRLTPKKENIEKWILRKYQVHKWSFVIGLLFILLSRSCGPVISMANKFCSVNT